MCYLCLSKKNMMESYILLENIVFYANHGVFLQENLVGNEYVVNLKMKLDLGKAGMTDNLDDTVSYADVYNIIKKEMEVPSKLLEHVAKRMILSIKGRFPQIDEIEVKLSKRNPPIGGQLDYASVVLIE